MAGDGGQTRSACYVDDTVSGILALAHSGFEGPVNIGNPTELTMLTLAETVRHLTGSESPIHFVGRPLDDPEVRRPDISLAASKLRWRPSVDVAEGLRRTIDWFDREIHGQREITDVSR
ncbi:hypothetical protein [Streptosporangium sp. NPDC049304]|uniref:hypothetical protein n=1 Tax=Streptosporangium sp. NPDC049304 TaxID=3154830 RepID=UPI003413B795